MKKHVKFLALILSVLMLASFVSACNNGGNSKETESSNIEENIITSEAIDTVESTDAKESDSTTSDTESSDADATESTATDTESTTTDTESAETEGDPNKPKEIYTVVENSKTEYSIVIPDTNPQAFTDAANVFRASFLEEFSNSITMIKESTYKTLHGGTMDGKKIVIGTLKNDSVSQSIYNALGDNSFIIKAVNGSVYISGNTLEATLRAVEFFIQTYMLTDHKGTLKFEEGVIYETDAAFPIGSLTIGSNPISKYSIIYYDSHYGKLAAQNIQAAISELAGITLPVKADTEAVGQYEILVGKTNRNESKSVRAKYDRPNVYYDIAEKNGKLVVMAEGFSTLEVVTENLIKYFKTLDNDHNIVGSAVSGDIILSDNANNKNEGNMLTRAANTEVRIMAWNMGGPGTYGKIDLAEKLADTILKNLPDVFGTNEFYDPPKGAYRTTFDAVLREISEYYYEIESDNDFPTDERLDTFVSQRGPRPQKIFIRKDAGIKVIAAGWRYTEYQKDVNYRSFPWAVLETKEGNKFIYTVSHYTDMTKDTAAAIEQLEAVKYAQEQSGCEETLPAILSGDIWMARGKGSYKYFTDAGYLEAQLEAAVNDNNNVNHGTFHDYGVLQTNRSATDRIMYSAGMIPLKFKVITSVEATDSSDHFPIICDFKFD